MKLLAFLAAVVIVAVAWVLVTGVIARWQRQRHQQWVVDQHSLPDGALQVVVRRGESDCRVVKELPAVMDALDFRVELDAAMDQARKDVVELNRR